MGDQATPWMRTTLNQPKLSREAERELLTKIRAGDETALAAIMISQFKTVFYIAKRYQNMGFDLDDLVQEGFAGLFRAIKKFNPNKGCCLATYASHWIALYISRALTSKGHMIRLPVHAQALLHQISKVSSLLSEELHRAPTDQELAERTGVDIMKMRTVQQCWRPTVSLDAQRFSPDAPEDSADFHMVFADPATLYDRSREEKLHKIELLQHLLADERLLEPEERAILNIRFGLQAHEPQTLKAIGERFGVTRERIRQIQNASLRKLRKFLKQSGTEFDENLRNCAPKTHTRRRKIADSASTRAPELDLVQV
jgi:RNA polymerase primary sigma factor